MHLVATLKTVPERNREATGDMIKRLTEAHARGEVGALTYAYLEKDKSCVFEISSETFLSEFAYLVATLQAKLTTWIQS